MRWGSFLLPSIPNSQFTTLNFQFPISPPASHVMLLLCRFFVAPFSLYERRSTPESVKIGKNR